LAHHSHRYALVVCVLTQQKNTGWQKFSGINQPQAKKETSMEKKRYGIAFLFALCASAVLYLSAYLSALLLPSLEGILAPLWSLFLLAVIFAVSIVSMRLVEQAVKKELVQDIVLDMVPLGKTQRFQVVVLVDCLGPKKQYIKLPRNITRRVIE
jgi:hypothetical protein